jgi:hypothetical protein
VIGAGIGLGEVEAAADFAREAYKLIDARQWHGL